MRKRKCNICNHRLGSWWRDATWLCADCAIEYLNKKMEVYKRDIEYIQNHEKKISQPESIDKLEITAEKQTEGRGESYPKMPQHSADPGTEKTEEEPTQEELDAYAKKVEKCL